MKKTTFLFCLLLLLVHGISYAAGPQKFIDPAKIKYPPLQFNPPKAERVELDNGMVLYFLEDNELPLVNINVLVHAGSYFDPEGKEGLADLTGTVMKTGGTDKATGDAVDETLESIAVNINFTTGLEETSISYSGLKNHLERGVDILSRIIMHPAFGEDKLALAKGLKSEELRRIADDPQQLSFRQFNRLIYKGDPRGRLPSSSSVAAVTRGDMVRFHREFFTPRNMMIALTGDIKKQEALDLLKKYFGKWDVPGGKRDAPPPLPSHAGGVYLIAKDIPQSVIITGRYAPAKTSPDSYPFAVIDFILGSGGFMSRIFQEIRTDQGLAYSAGSFYKARNDYGVFVTYAMTKSSSTGKALSLMSQITDGARKNPADAKELAWAKRSINNSFIFSFNSPAQVARQQMALEFEGLPADYLSSYRERIAKVSHDDLKRAAEKYLSSADRIILVAGKENGFDMPLSSFGNVETLKIND